VERNFHSSVQGQGPRKGAKSSKGVAATCDRLGYFVDLYFPRVGHYPRMGAQILYQQNEHDTGFPLGAFPGVFT
jgi:hypothetical protein